MKKPVDTQRLEAATVKAYLKRRGIEGLRYAAGYIPPTLPAAAFDSPLDPLYEQLAPRLLAAMFPLNALADSLPPTYDRRIIYIMLVEVLIAPANPFNLALELRSDKALHKLAYILARFWLAIAGGWHGAFDDGLRYAVNIATLPHVIGRARQYGALERIRLDVASRALLCISEGTHNLDALRSFPGYIQILREYAMYRRAQEDSPTWMLRGTNTMVGRLLVDLAWLEPDVLSLRLRRLFLIWHKQETANHLRSTP